MNLQRMTSISCWLRIRLGQRIRVRLRHRHLDNERGAVLAAVGIGMIAVLAMVGVGFGLGRLTLAATEAQSAADVAALTGAMAMFTGSDPEDDALAALASNTIESWTAESTLDALQPGFYNYDTRKFFAGSLPTNAVMARVETTVNNGLAALLGTPTTDVEKIAYASFSGLRGASPTLPIVIGECHFEEDCFDQSCMPHLTQVPSTSDNSAWTGFFDGRSNTAVSRFFPTECDGDGKVQAIWIGDTIQIGNGQVSPLLDAVDCMYDLGLTRHIIPIVNCNGNFNQTRQVVGFATIEVDYVIRTGNQKGIYLHAIFRSNATGAVGGSNFGTGNIALVPVNP